MWRVTMSSVSAKKYSTQATTTHIRIGEGEIRAPSISHQDLVNLKFVRLTKTAEDAVRDLLGVFLELFDGFCVRSTGFVTCVSVVVILVNDKAAMEAESMPPPAEWGQFPQSFWSEMNHKEGTWSWEESGACQQMAVEIKINMRTMAFLQDWFRHFSSPDSGHHLRRQGRLLWSFSSHFSNLWILQSRPHRLLRARHICIHSDIQSAGGRDTSALTKFPARSVSSVDRAQQDVSHHFLRESWLGTIRCLGYAGRKRKLTLRRGSKISSLTSMIPKRKTSFWSISDNLWISCEPTYPSRYKFSLRSTSGKEDGIPVSALRHRARL